MTNFDSHARHQIRSSRQLAAMIIRLARWNGISNQTVLNLYSIIQTVFCAVPGLLDIVSSKAIISAPSCEKKVQNTTTAIAHPGLDKIDRKTISTQTLLNMNGKTKRMRIVCVQQGSASKSWLLKLSRTCQKQLYFPGILWYCSRRKSCDIFTEKMKESSKKNCVIYLFMALLNFRESLVVLWKNLYQLAANLNVQRLLEKFIWTRWVLRIYKRCLVGTSMV